LTGTEQIHAVLGGMHLIHASSERIQSTIKALENMNVDLLGLSHCTGSAAADKIKTVFCEKCFEYITGIQISFEMVKSEEL
jgi:7,8-dihydropterin-6-yl-methyl-4-(beta-D-ribofuranosyl)aminobenzene 5'-phosphate synthase